jgi:hypothetical protein
MSEPVRSVELSAEGQATPFGVYWELVSRDVVVGQGFSRGYPGDLPERPGCSYNVWPLGQVGDMISCKALHPEAITPAANDGTNGPSILNLLAGLSRRAASAPVFAPAVRGIDAALRSSLASGAHYADLSLSDLHRQCGGLSNVRLLMVMLPEGFADIGQVAHDGCLMLVRWIDVMGPPPGEAMVMRLHLDRMAELVQIAA